MSRKEFNKYGITLMVTSFAMRFLTVGLFRCFGIILRELNDLHEFGKGELNWIPSVNAGCMFLLGPAAGNIQHKLGCRVTIIIGSVLASAGLAASMFVPNLHILYATYGVMTGSGFCLVSLSANIPINTYFQDKRILAHSLAGLGASSGIAIMPYLMAYLLEVYGWRGTFVILSGLYLHCAICGMLIWPTKQEVKRLYVQSTAKVIYGREKRRKKEKPGKKTGEGEHLRKLELGLTSHPKDVLIFVRSLSSTCVTSVTLPEALSIAGIRINETLNSTTTSQQGEELLKTHGMGKDTNEKHSSLQDTKSILKNKHFLMYSSSAFVVKHVFHVPHLMIPIMMSSYGYSPTMQATVFTATGVCSMLQRVVIGSFLDKAKAHTMAIMGLSIMSLGLATFSLAFVKAYVLFVSYGALFGILAGLYGNLQATTLLGIIGKRRYGLGLGYYRFLVGMGVSTGPPIAGWLIDKRGHFDWVYYYGGVFFICGGILLLFIYLFKKREIKFNRKRDSETGENEIVVEIQKNKETTVV